MQVCLRCVQIILEKLELESHAFIKQFPRKRPLWQTNYTHTPQMSTEASESHMSSLSGQQPRVDLPRRREFCDIDFSLVWERINKVANEAGVVLGDIVSDARDGSTSHRSALLCMTALLTDIQERYRRFRIEFSSEIPTVDLINDLVREINQRKVLSIGSGNALWEALILNHAPFTEIFCTDKFTVGWFPELIPPECLIETAAQTATPSEEDSENLNESTPSPPVDSQPKEFKTLDGQTVHLKSSDSITELGRGIVEGYSPYGIPVHHMNHTDALKEYGSKFPVLLLIDPTWKVIVDCFRHFWGDTVLYMGPAPGDLLFDKEFKLSKLLSSNDWEIRKIFELPRFMVLDHRSHAFVIQKRKT